MNEMSRRAVIASAAAVGAAAMLPRLSVVAPAVASPAAAAMPMWSVGTPGEWDWLAIAAPDDETARREWVAETLGGSECEIEVGDRGPDFDPNECDCEWCSAFQSAEADRQPSWDGKDVKIGNADWIAVGLGALCDKCGYETHQDNGGRVVAGKLFCEECLPLEANAPALSCTGGDRG